MTKRDKQELAKLIVAAIAVFLLICLPVWIYRACQSVTTAEEDSTVDIEHSAGAPQPVHLQRSIKVNDDGKIKKMDLEDYVLGVLAGEMPASFEPEALKAQAVAARTFTIKKQETGGCSRGGDICTESSHCQAFQSEKARKKQWGENYAEYETKLKRAVDETAGLIVVYDGEPIEAMFHSTAGGMTENSENAYTTALPYLRSVVSNEVDAPRYEGEVTVSRSEFAKSLNAKGAKIKSSELENEVFVKSRFDSGRVKELSAGGVILSGSDMRKLFSLDSTNFSIDFSANDVTIHTKGFGHGVGLSQTGANDMAKEGARFDEILTYYYTGTIVAPLTDI